MSDRSCCKIAYHDPETALSPLVLWDAPNRSHKKHVPWTFWISPSRYRLCWYSWGFVDVIIRDVHKWPNLNLGWCMLTRLRRTTLNTYERKHVFKPIKSWGRIVNIDPNIGPKRNTWVVYVWMWLIMNVTFNVNQRRILDGKAMVRMCPQTSFFRP